MSDSDDPGPQNTQGLSKTSLPEKVDVLVIGYGPVGAALACLLGRYGVDTLVVDRAKDILMMPRAIGLDNEALRILAMAGLEEDAFDRIAIPEVHMISPYVGEFLRFNVAGVIDGFPKLAMFYQPDLEKALRRQAATIENVRCQGGVELLSFEDEGHRVTALVRHEDGREQTIEARYLIGADGASSRIRNLIGEDFHGQSYAEDWLIVDAQDVPTPQRHIDFYCGSDRPGPHMPAPGNRQRWEFMLGENESAEEMEQDHRIKELLAPWGDPADMHIERKAVYRFHARCCENFRKSSVFLAGDAAHITPPFVGQGLVSGLRDAANLCWKIAWDLRGHAQPALLDSYDIERRPHAKAMIDLARLMGRVIMPRSPLRARLIHGFVKALRMLPYGRTWLDDLKLKPRNNYKEGFFVAGKRKIQRGGWLPQHLVRCPDGEIRLSDAMVEDDFVVVGFGVDPGPLVDQDVAEAWARIGGRFVQLAMRGQVMERSPGAYEDLTGELVPETAPKGWIAVLRPDRIVLHDGPSEQATTLIRESLALLGVSAFPPNDGNQG